MEHSQFLFKHNISFEEESSEKITEIVYTNF